MEEEYYSFEQFICAALACYSPVLLAEDIKNLKTELERYLPEMCMANDIVRYTNEYINYTPERYTLNEPFNLDTLGEYENQTITLGDYFKVIAGPKLVAFMQSEKMRKSVGEAFGGR